jgi:hypothetical protein
LQFLKGKQKKDKNCSLIAQKLKHFDEMGKKINDNLIKNAKKLGALEIPRRSPIQVLIEPSSA